MKIALYFGSFNPLHRGHTSIIQYLLEHSDVDAVRLVISPHSPFKEGQYNNPDGLTNEEFIEYQANARLVALREAVKRSGLEVQVSDIEYHLPKPLYTINTLRIIREKEVENEHILIMGADNFNDIERWHKWQELLNEFEVWVYPREGYKEIEEKCKKYTSPQYNYRVKFLNAPLYNISSTEIRNGNSLDQKV